MKSTVDYSDYTVNRSWHEVVVRPSADKGRTKPFLPFLIVAILAVIVAGVAFATTGMASTAGGRLTIESAFLEHNGVRVERSSRTFAGLSSDEAVTASGLVSTYQEISRTLLRISTDLELEQTSAVAATALVRNLEGDALTALATLGAMYQSDFRDAYTEYFLYAVQRLGELTGEPTADRLWTAARELWVR